ncbi:MAG: hypothetical protein UT90_C0016G0010 [Parcubacteria group bacterium GW2011_GWA1_40_21]|nr:MAG: hypothetical protein UT80_C0004G0049 [Parcubacteria group bacterium GW2011_GWC1_40_13]KKR52988.1 MAG: hypothetical protein UT90_C0016G0010 [Parcubacteria group bacterium GW2011_GWA1_40_21]
MFNISIYLDKFKNIESKSSNLKNIIIDSVKNILKTDIDKKNIEIKNGIVYLKVNPVLKNEIFINKNSLIKDLSAKNLSIKGIF